MKTRSLILIGVASFLAFLIASAPIATIHARLASADTPLQLSGLSGSVFAGSADSFGYQGRELAHPLNWRFDPLALITARLGYRVDGSVNGLLFDGKLARTLGGDLRVSAMQASGSLKGLLALSGDIQMPLDGDVGLKLDTLTIAERFPKQASADLSLVGLRWSLGPKPMQLGDYAIAVVTEAGVIIGRVAPTAGPLDVGGELRLNPDRSFEVDLRIKAKPEAEPAVQNLVRSLGQPDTEGYFRIKTRQQF